MKKQEHASIRRFPRLEINAKRLYKGVHRFNPSKLSETSWLIENFLADRSIQLCYGSFGTSKTTTLLKAGWCVSQGIPFLGMPTQRRVVLYLDYENPPDVLKAYCESLGIDPNDPWFTIWDRATSSVPIPHNRGGRLRQFIRRCVRETGMTPWIIFDSWTSLLRGDESQGHKVSDIFLKIRKLADIGVPCTVVDHTPKGKDGSETAVGSYAKMTQMDTSHNFRLVGKQTSWFTSIPSHKIYHVKSFLKRYAPDGTGSFSFEVIGKQNENGKWRIESLERTEDKKEGKKLDVIESMKKLIRDNPTLGKMELADSAVEQKLLEGRDAARSLLEQGVEAKAWKSTKSGKSHKQTFKVVNR